jgi:5'-3' exonuclease
MAPTQTPTQSIDAFQDATSNRHLVTSEPAVKLENSIEQALVIKTDDDIRREAARPKQDNDERSKFESITINRPVVKHRRVALTTIIPSPTLLSLIENATSIHIDDAWEKEEDKGGEYYRVRLERMVDFDCLIKQAAKEIVRYICRTLGSLAN